MEKKPMNHVFLLGDSIFDNGRYVPGGSSVEQRVRLRDGLVVETPFLVK